MFFTDEQLASIQHQIEAGFFIEAIKLVRQYTGFGLKDSKDIVDFWRANGIPPKLGKQKTDNLEPPIK
jgi:ribosomal protein L7/L12